jgi:putative MFS transporter
VTTASNLEGVNLLARLDRIPVWPYHRSLLWVVGASYFFAFFDAVSIGFALPVIEREFDLSKSTASLAVTLGLAGYVVGALVDSRVADARGRRLALQLSVGTLAVGAIAAAASPTFAFLVVARFVVGMGVGSEIAAVTAYLSEISPASVRGRVTGAATTAAFSAFTVVPLAAWALVPRFDAGWRVLFLLGAAGALAVLPFRLGLPRSPRWLVDQGRVEEAEALIGAAEDRARLLIGTDLPPPAAGVREQRAPVAHMFRPPLVARTALLVVLWFVYYVANYGWLTLAPTLIASRGYSLSRSLGFLVISGLGYIVGAVLAARVADRFERKLIVLVAVVVFGLVLGAIGFEPRPAVIIVCGFVAAMSIGVAIPGLYTLTAEHFPTSLRATGVAVSDGIGHLGGALAPVLVLTATGSNFRAGFLVMAGAALLTGALMPFTHRGTGRALEDLA